MFGRLQMDIFNGLESIVKTDYPLSCHTWYGLGGPADYLAIKVIGFGSNLLVSDEGVRAAVINLQDGVFKTRLFNESEVTAWAGAELAALVLACVRQGLSGMEAMTGIPGSVGGAIRMNAGGSFGDIGSVVERVTLMDASGSVFERSKPELTFDYRRSNIVSPFILSAVMKLSSGDPEQIMRQVKEIWIYKKNNQPLNTKNSGCIFKNPPEGPAGALIDRAGLKGLQVGGASVSEKHANFIVARAGCKSRDVLRLIEAVRERVREKSGVELELEIEIWK
jgi:UDP-N-acetylmuramate dehydrogenase